MLRTMSRLTMFTATGVPSWKLRAAPKVEETCQGREEPKQQKVTLAPTLTEPAPTRTRSDAHGGPELLHVVLRDEGDHRVGGDTHVVGGEARPQTGDAALLHLRLDVVEGQGKEGGEEARDGPM